MERKEVGQAEAPGDVAGVTAGRAAQLLGLSNPDSVRQLKKNPESLLERNADGLYTLASVIKERARREAKAQRLTPTEAAA